MQQLNQTEQPTATQTAKQGKGGRPILHVSKPRGPNAQSTSFLRRRKVVQILAQQTQGTYVKPEPNPELQTYPDYPILDLSEDFQGEISGHYPYENSHQHRMASPQHDECLSTEYWTIQGMVNGNFMNQLPMNNHALVHSMDM